PGEEGTAGDPPGAAEPGLEAATATDGAALDLLGRVATPEDVELLLGLALAASEHDRLDVARRLVEAAARLAPGDAEVLLAIAALDPGQLDRLEGIELGAWQAVRYAELLAEAGRAGEACERLEAALLAELALLEGERGHVEWILDALVDLAAPEAVAR